MNELKITEFAEKIGGLISSVQGVDRKIDEYCRMNQEEHKTMRRNIDKLWIVGLLILAASLSGVSSTFVVDLLRAAQ